MSILLLSAALLAATAFRLSARFAPPDAAAQIVAAYLFAFAEVVGVSLILSTFSSLGRWPVLLSLVVVFAVVVVGARPARFPAVRRWLAAVANDLREPPLAALALVVLGVASYALAIALFLPPNDQDALEYHLPRAALWKQQQGIGYISGAGDARLDGLPPNSEIAMAFTMIASGTGRFATLVQFVAAFVAAVAIYGIARRLGIGSRGALFAGLLFPTLPVVALQAGTALNDVVVAALACATALFLLSDGRASLVIAGLGTALLVGTKLTGILALPGLALLAIVGRTRDRALAVAAGAVGAAVGSYWYWVNLVRVGDPLGASAVSGDGISGEGVGPDPVAAVARIARLLIAALEVPGAVGLDRLLYAGAAFLVAAAIFAGRGTRADRAKRAALAGVATLVPLALLPLAELLLTASQKLFAAVGREDIAFLDPERSRTKASPIFSWYGPLGVLLTIFACVRVTQRVRRRELGRVTLVVAAAPLLWIILLGIAVPYWEWNGRYVVAGFALGAAAWGAIVEFRPLAWAATAVAALTALLAFVHLHDRPSGVRLLEPNRDRSIWAQPDWAVQATDHEDLRALLRFTATRVPTNATVAVEPNVWPGRPPRGGLPVFVFFEPDLTREVHFAQSPQDAARVDADWAVLRADGDPASGWATAFRHDPWVVLRRRE